jgi:hypothetical protein
MCGATGPARDREGRPAASMILHFACPIQDSGVCALCCALLCAVCARGQQSSGTCACLPPSAEFAGLSPSLALSVTSQLSGSLFQSYKGRPSCASPTPHIPYLVIYPISSISYRLRIYHPDFHITAGPLSPEPRAAFHDFIQARNLHLLFPPRPG